MSMFYVNKNKEICVSKGLTLASPAALAEKTPVNAVAASGTITVSGTPVAEDVLTIGTQEFTFVTTRSDTGEITISATPATQAANIKTAVDADLTNVVATRDTAVVTITAAVKGTAGNSIVLTENATGITVNGSGTLSGGVNGTTGVVNELCADGTYLYHCIAANDVTGTNWRRIALGSAY